MSAHRYVFRGPNSHNSRNRPAETRHGCIRWIWYRGRAMASLYALVGTEKHVIDPKSSEMTVHWHDYISIRIEIRRRARRCARAPRTCHQPRDTHAKSVRASEPAATHGARAPRLIPPRGTRTPATRFCDICMYYTSMGCHRIIWQIIRPVLIRNTI